MLYPTNLIILQAFCVVKGATKLYFMLSACMVTILFNTDLYRSAFSTYSLKKLFSRLSVFYVFCLYYVEFSFIFEEFLENICNYILHRYHTLCYFVLTKEPLTAETSRQLLVTIHQSLVTIHQLLVTSYLLILITSSQLIMFLVRMIFVKEIRGKCLVVSSVYSSQYFF